MDTTKGAQVSRRASTVDRYGPLAAAADMGGGIATVARVVPGKTLHTTTRVHPVPAAHMAATAAPAARDHTVAPAALAKHTEQEGTELLPVAAEEAEVVQQAIAMPVVAVAEEATDIAT